MLFVKRILIWIPGGKKMKRNKIIIGIIAVIIISVCVLLVFLLGSKKSNAPEGTIEENGKNDIIEEDIVISEEEAAAIWDEDPDTDPYYDLSSEGELESDGVVQAEEIFLIDNKFKTNSTKITIANQENIPITVYLYNTLRPESSIQEMAVEPLGNGTFANLTAKYLYSIGVVSAEDAQFKITIGD